MNDWKLDVVTPPGEPAVSLETAKLHLRIDHDDEDALIAGYVEAGIVWAEGYQSRSFVTRTYRLTLPRFPFGSRRPIRLPRPPVQSIVSVAYRDPAGDMQVLAPAGYLVVENEVHLLGESWPRTERRPDAVEIEYTAGYGVPGDVPGPVVSAILLLVGHLYENREAGLVATGPTFEVPFGVRPLLAMQRATTRDPLGAR